MNGFKNKIVIITGGAGFLGIKHAEAIIESDGIPIIWDIDKDSLNEAKNYFKTEYNISVYTDLVDITKESEVNYAFEQVRQKHGSVDILINNAACNPKVENSDTINFSRLENYSLKTWNKELDVGITGAFICAKIIGSYMAENGGGNIINISSDLGIIAPDQRLYRLEGVPDNLQPVKPVTYSVVKHGLIGLTKYLASYWADKNIRVNAFCPGGVYNGQDEEFVKKLTNLIPMGRMANVDEYKGVIKFLCSDASSYMTGTCLSADGGRTCW